MKTLKKDVRVVSLAVVAAMLLSAASALAGAMDPAGGPAMGLTGAQEVPPVTTSASGKNMLVIGADKSVSGSVTVAGMTPTAAHIHEAPKGKNGPVIVPFSKTGDNTFGPAPGAKLTDAQYASYQAGNLYVNVHSAAHPGGEVRMQLAPK
jgi:hypothetical protein